MDRLFSIHIPGRKTLFKHSVVGLMRHCRVCFWRGQTVSRKKQTEKKERLWETIRNYKPWLKARRNVLKTQNKKGQ